MAGLSADTPIPTDIRIRQLSRLVDIEFSDGARFGLPFEYLRVYSPSAEVRGHGEGQEVLQTGKRNVGLTSIEPVGNYAVKLVFSDGHSSGLYSWDLLYRLGRDQDALWADYLARLEAAGASRDEDTTPTRSSSRCAHRH